MSKILAVFGATGQQGSSVVNYVLNDPQLSNEYRLRVITRDINSEKAKQLSEKGIEVVRGDLLDRTSIETALTGVHTVFAMTTPSFGPDSEAEFNTGKLIADVAVKMGASYIIFSTLPPAKEISGGKYTKVIHFDGKAKVEQYIRGLNVKSAFVSLGCFMENFQAMPFLGPQKAANGTWALRWIVSPQAQQPLIDAVGDTGKFVGAILAEPDKYEGQKFCCATALYSMEEIAATMSKVTGKTVIYEQIPAEEWTSSLGPAADIMVETFSFIEDFGYDGQDSAKLVAWAAENARGRLSTFEEYLKAHPLQLA